MWQITLITFVRVILILVIGILLYRALLYMAGYSATYRLRRRRRCDDIPISRRTIFRWYVIVLMGIILIGVLFIKFYVQDV